MADKIKLTRHRNVNLARREAGDVLVVGKDLTMNRALTLVRIGGAEWYKNKENKKLNPVLEVKAK